MKKDDSIYSLLSKWIQLIISIVQINGTTKNTKGAKLGSTPPLFDDCRGRKYRKESSAFVVYKKKSRDLDVIVYTCLFILGLWGCKWEKIDPIPKEGILFLGHTYRWHTASDRVDERVERLPLEKYEQLWLGGDMCSETTEKYTTLEYLDELFDLGNPNTHWTLGNHDARNGNRDWIREFTGRELHYTHRFQDMMIVVTHTNYRNPEHCKELESQYEMIRQLCDTIQDASHLVLLSHLVTWGKVEDAMNVDSFANANREFWEYRCTPPAKFPALIYPMLVKVQERGIQVVVISGDAGQRAKTYEYQTAEGVWFLASGINNSFEKDPEIRKTLPPDHVLYLEYDAQSRQLWWEFQNLDELIN